MKSKRDIVNKVSNKLTMNQQVSEKEIENALNAINYLIKNSKGKNTLSLKYERDYIEFKSSPSFNNYLSAGVI